MAQSLTMIPGLHFLHMKHVTCTGIPDSLFMKPTQAILLLDESEHACFTAASASDPEFILTILFWGCCLQDLAVLVHDQGEMIDDIDSNITRTAQHTEEANTQLRHAERHQRASRNRQCFILMVVGIVLAILVVILVITS